MASQETLNKPVYTKEQQNIIEGILKAKALGPSELPLSSSDTIICSSPKSGTTWLKALAFCIITRTRFDPFSEHHPILASVSHDLIPFIEVDIAKNHTPRDPELPLLSTHMPFASLPGVVLDSGCKMVYICRNPKDVLVSYWHFLNKIPDKGEIMSLETAFDLFCKGALSLYGNYWDHVLGFWKASLGYPERVLFLKYEDMMGDAVNNIVEKLAEFVGFPFSEKERQSGVIARIVEMCSFGSLSKLEVNITGKFRGRVCNEIFFRKAKVGDWTNDLTPEMANKLDQITFQKLDNSGLTM